jgi:peptide chain release factor 2
LERSSPLSEGIFDIVNAQKRIPEIDQMASLDGFWNDAQKARELLKEKATLETKVTAWDKQRRALDDAQVLLELALEANDEASAREAARMAEAVAEAVGEIEFSRMLSGEHDGSGCLVAINAGAGGTDAQDWAEMLQRMYFRWCERKGFKVELIDSQPGEEAGIKSCAFQVTGDWAYGFLKAENGVHRLVRISPFDANARRQTAFASVFVYPEVDDSIQIDIKEEDLEWQTFRSGGAGGQHVNKTESAVRVIHKPTGTVAACQLERSQHKNRSMAMKMLRAKLYDIKLREQEAKMNDVHAQKKAIEWGSQIRSYVLAPYRQVTDHRTELKVGNVDAVLDGELDQFIRTYLMQRASEQAAPN